MSGSPTPVTVTPAKAAAAVENPSMVELQETVSRLSSHKGVEAVLILNKKGDKILVQSGSAADQKQAVFVKKLLQTATFYLQSLQPDDEVTFLQVRSKQQQEVMIAPHGDFVLAVLKR